MGFAHGQLMKERLLHFFPEVYAYMETQVSSKNGTFTKLVEKFGLEEALDLSYDATKVRCFLPKLFSFTQMQMQAYIKPYVTEELQGMADATGLPIKEIRSFISVNHIFEKKTSALLLFLLCDLIKTCDVDP